jgi:proline iminopeptidase
VSVGDVRLYFEVFGQQRPITPDATSINERPAVIGLHGGPGGDGAKLRFLLPRLSDLAQVIVVDQRGHGRSDQGSQESWNLAQWAADVRAFADALEIQRPVVLGESFGGFVAQQYAGTYPEHPAALILISCGPRFARPHESAAQVGDPSASEQVAALVARAAEQRADEQDWLSVMQPLLAVRNDPVLDRLQRLRASTPEVNRHFEPEGFSMDLRPYLANVRCPTLLLVGERDPLVPAHLAQELVGALPLGVGRLEMIANASHQVLTDNPTDSWRLIRDFLTRLA